MLCVFRPVRRTISQVVLTGKWQRLALVDGLASGFDDDDDVDGKLLPDDDPVGVFPSSTPLSRLKNIKVLHVHQKLRIGFK